MFPTDLFVSFIADEQVGLRSVGMKVSGDVRRGLKEDYDEECWQIFLRRLHEGVKRDSRANSLPILFSFTEEPCQD